MTTEVLCVMHFLPIFCADKNKKKSRVHGSERSVKLGRGILKSPTCQTFIGASGSILDAESLLCYTACWSYSLCLQSETVPEHGNQPVLCSSTASSGQALILDPE